MGERKQSGKECTVRFNALVTKERDTEVHSLTRRNAAKSLNLSLSLPLSLVLSPWHVRNCRRWGNVQVQDGWFLLPACRSSTAVGWLGFTRWWGTLEDIRQFSRDKFVTFIPQANKQIKSVPIKEALIVHSKSIILHLEFLWFLWYSSQNSPSCTFIT